MALILHNTLDSNSTISVPNITRAPSSTNREVGQALERTLTSYSKPASRSDEISRLLCQKLMLATLGTVQPDILALTAAVGWAISGILVRKGSKHSAVASAVLLSLLATACSLWSVGWWYFPLGFLHSPAIFYFVLGGLIQPAFVRFLNYTGISRLGASRAQALRAATPLFASVIALIALHERPGIEVYIAIFLTVTGIGLVSYRREGESDWKIFDRMTGIWLGKGLQLYWIIQGPLCSSMRRLYVDGCGAISGREEFEWFDAKLL
jgi:uncharacterized membrane protein